MRRLLVGRCLLAWLALLSSVSAEELRLKQTDDPLPVGAVARLGSNRLRHGDHVWGLAFTPDGRGLLAGGSDGSLILWDVATGRERVRLLENGPAITAVAVSPDGKVLVSCDRFCGGHSQVIVWSADGQRVDSWLVRDSEINILLFLPGGHSLLMLGGERTCRDIRTGRLRPPLKGIEHCVSAVVSPDGRTLAIQDWHLLNLYDLPSCKLRVQVGPTQGNHPAVQLAFSPDGRELFSLGKDGQIEIRNPKTGKVDRVVQAANVCPLLVEGPDHSHLILNNQWTRTKWVCRPLLSARFRSGFESARSVALSPDGHTLAVAYGDKQIRLWDLRTGKQRLPGVPVLGLDRHCQPQVQLSPDGRLLGLLDWDGTLTIGKREAGSKVVRPLWRDPEGAVCRFAFSADGKQAITVEEGAGPTWRLTFRDAVSGKVRRLFPSVSEPIRFLAVSPDGRWLAEGAGESGKTSLWDTTQQRSFPIPCKAGQSIGTAVFSADSRTLITGGNSVELHSGTFLPGRR